MQPFRSATAMGAMAALSLLPAAAQAFCGTYVGSPGAELYSSASQVVLAREGDRTVLTFANDYQGDLAEFAMVVPVPQVLDEGDVQVLDPQVLDRVAGYTGPRLVEYDCEDFLYQSGAGRGSPGCGCTEPGMADASSGGLAAPGAAPLDVTVENEFQAGEYTIQVLSSEDAADLVTWLRDEGYGVDEDAEAMLGEYIDSGAYFFAAKVVLDEVPTEDTFEGAPYLSPLQVTYDADTFGLPIRLGTLNSPGSQDLVITTLTGPQDGQAAITNYPKVEIEDECMWDEARHGDLPALMDDQMQEAVDAEDGAGWMLAYGWQANNCDPCPPEGPLGPEDVRALGYEGSPERVYATRLWMRYAPEAATQDVALYTTGDAYAMDQLRYITYKPELESQFPTCLEGFAEDPGSCDDMEDDGSDGARTRDAGLPWLPPALFFGGVLLGSALRRRRS